VNDAIARFKAHYVVESAYYVVNHIHFMSMRDRGRETWTKMYCECLGL